MSLQAAEMMIKYTGYLGVQANKRYLTHNAKTELSQHAPWANLVAACTLLHVNGQGRRHQVLRNLEQVSSMSCFVCEMAAHPAAGLFLMDCSLHKISMLNHKCTSQGL